MKTKVLFTAILVVGVLFTSCEKDDFDVIPSSNVTTTDFSASNISELDVSDVFNVYVSFSDTEESVQVEANKNMHSLIEINQSGGRLIVGLQENTNISGMPVLNVYIKTATLSNVKAVGASFIEFENPLENNLLEIDLTGASKFKGTVETGTLVAYLEGASKIEMNGSADNIQIDLVGASEMSGFNFSTNQLKADLYGASEVSMVVNEKLDITASGGSKVYYKGNGIIERQDLSDVSEIIKMD